MAPLHEPANVIVQRSFGATAGQVMPDCNFHSQALLHPYPDKFVVIAYGSDDATSHLIRLLNVDGQ